MKKYFFILALGWLFWGIETKAAFVEGLEDVPLPNGLNQIDNAALNFGNEEIRFIENYLTSTSLSFDDVKSFYAQTLPQIGWKKTKSTYEKILFERDGETLEINKESAKPLVVRLTVKSKNQ